MSSGSTCVAAWLALLLSGAGAQHEVHAARLDCSAAARLPVQDHGRTKPLDSFARETLLALAGRPTIDGQDPVETLLSLWLGKQGTSIQIAQVGHKPLREELGLDPDRRHFSYDELASLIGLRERAKLAEARLQDGAELGAAESEILAVAARVGQLAGIIQGTGIRIVPHPTDRKAMWKGPAALQGSGADAFGALLTAYTDGRSSAFTAACEALRGSLARLAPAHYPSSTRMNREVHYHRFHPFRKAWILYLAAWAGLLLNTQTHGRGLYRAGLVLLGAGWLLHTYGFLLRCVIAQRPPVTNMYESVVWVSWGIVLFALFFEMRTRVRWFAIGAAPLAVLGLILADAVPAVLNPSLSPLLPVLRSNFWLSVHVLVITLSYAAFALALALGHLLVGFLAVGQKTRALAPSLDGFIFRLLQTGILLLAAGTVLGGVWAHYSWGRFWGWDPKETWALIALVSYLAVLHARAAGWISPLGLGVASIVCFLGILMAWYGVNFLLGEGLHTYGFGTGGTPYVLAFTVCELLFVAGSIKRYRKHRSPRPNNAPEA